MDYYESAEGKIISYDRMLQELDRHGYNREAEIKELHDDLGKRDTYLATDVLDFLGY